MKRCVGVLVGLALTACARAPESLPAHAAGQPTFSAAPGLRVGVDRPFARRFLDNVETSYFSDRSLATVRMQAWATAIHRRLSERHPEALMGVPEPVVFISRKRDLNATSVAVPVCFDAEAEAGTDLSAESRSVNVLVLRPAKNSLAEYVDEERCASDAEAGLTLDDVLEAYQAQGAHCRVERTRAGGIRFSGTCAGMPEGHVVSRRVAFMLSSNVVVIVGGILTDVDEPAAVASLAHELAHYYRAHISRVDQGFFYQQESGENRAVTPEPTRDPELLALGARLTNAVTLTAEGVRGQRFHPEVIRALVLSDDELPKKIRNNCMVEADLGNDVECASACRDFLDDLEDRTIFRLARFGKGEERREPYLQLENDFARCAAALPLSADGGPGTLPFGLPLERQWRPWNETLEPAYRDQDPRTLKEAVDLLSDEFDRIARVQEEDRERAVETRLGWYSHEEEADNVAAEILTEVGIAPAALQDLFFAILARRSSERDSLGSKECRAAMESGWRDEDGRSIQVPVGSWDDEHHSPCYRIFQVDREIRAHGWERFRSNAPSVGPESWDEVREAVERVLRRE